MTKYEELARKIANSYGFSSDEDGLLASLLERELAPLVEAAQNELLSGKHDGDCDNINEYGEEDGPCGLHLDAAQQRKEALRSALKGWER